MGKGKLMGQGLVLTGTAVEADVKTGKTFSNASGTGKTGTLVVPSSVPTVVTLTTSQTWTVPAGVYRVFAWLVGGGGGQDKGGNGGSGRVMIAYFA